MSRPGPAFHLILVVADLTHVRHLGVVGLSEQASEARRLEQRILSPKQRRHPVSQRFVAGR